MNLNEWAIDWGVPFEAVEDLRRRMGVVDVDGGIQSDGDSEADVANVVRLEASAKGCRLMRNNVGAFYAQDGRFIRYGLANSSAEMNARVKSHDFIGIRPVLIKPEHVGRTIGQFLSREVKRRGWRYTATPKEQAQLAFAEFVLSMGGDAAFANGGGSI